MTGPRPLHRIHRKSTDGVHRSLVQFRIQRRRGCLIGHGKLLESWVERSGLVVRDPAHPNQGADWSDTSHKPLNSNPRT